MDKKEVAGAVYFEECLDELPSTQFDAVIEHLRNKHDVRFARYPKPRDAARKLVERDDGAKILSEAIQEVRAANKSLGELEAMAALERLERMGD